jgi:hypothetical protein
MHWYYAKRSDGKVAITLDNNVWNFLFNGNVDLVSELPPDRFAIYITREVEIETFAIPDRESKKELKDYIATTIAACGIKTTSIFGFAHEGPGPQRHGGFDVGVWQSQTETEFYAAIRHRFLVGKSEKNSKLFDNEGDAAVAAKSFSSIVLTCERPNKPGPLSFAAAHGGKVLYLHGFEQSGLTLREFIEDFYQKT